MAVKTFTSEVLTSADTNTYLANSGLVYVTSATIGTAVASVSVTGAFNSTYDQYYITVTGGAASTTALMYFALTGSTTGYYGGIVYVSYATGSVSGGNANNAANVLWGGLGTTNVLSSAITLGNPNNAKVTTIQSEFIETATGGNGGVFHGFLNNTTSYTGFTFTLASGTMTGGTINVYGYRKA